MSTFTTMLRASSRILAILAFFGVLMATTYTPASAQPCTSSSGCSMVPHCNLTVPATVYQVTFLLCCGGLTVISAPYTIMPSAGPCPPYVASQTYIPPAGCTVLGLASMNPFPPFGFMFSPAACTLTIY
jgi:hypothetical protein